MLRKTVLPVLFLLFGSAVGQNQSQNKPIQAQQLETRRQNFDTGRQLLLNKGVPFDPDELLRDGWTKSLKNTLDALPEMHQTRHETAPLHGAYLADTLYLPEKVQLSGHTLILANYVVFEGKNPVIKGNYDIHFFPAKPVVVLETSLAEVLRKKAALLYAKLGERPALPSFSLIQDIGRRGGHVITFDASGPEPQALRSPPRKPVLRAASWSALPPAILLAQTCSTGCNTSGDTGITGTGGTPGTFGVDGTSPPKSADGFCPTAPDGELGNPGVNGQGGGDGGNGGQGGQGGNAGNINATVADGDPNQYNFIANGGVGGFGGQGGDGGRGGNGGSGGGGGNGVACGCQVGSGGDPGRGGSGATGGKGGNGGPGGPGGAGGTITVSLPFYTGGATTSNFGGNGGLGAGGGRGGAAGNAGLPGIPGTGASACGNKGPDGVNNFAGQQGTAGNSGNAGANGPAGSSGPPPNVSVRPGGGTGGGSDQCGGGIELDPSGCPNSPIIIDTEGEGFHLTSTLAGVTFDISGTGHPIQIAWSDSHFHNAFLALPGQDGLVHNGKELFGNFTPQPQSSHPNGFIALAQFDKPENGGNGDGVIDERDAVYSRLRLWIDANHDGICQAEELHRLPELGVYSLALNYVESRKTDQFGNEFRYKALVNPGERKDPRDQSGNPGRLTYDVFLVAK